MPAPKRRPSRTPAATRPPSPLEHKEQSDLATWLRAALPFGTWTTTANGFLRTSAQRKAAAQQGVCFGMPDVLIFLQPACWVELKRRNGTASDVEDRQELVHRVLRDKCGMEGIVAFGADEAIAWLKERYGPRAPPPPGSTRQ